MLESNHDDRLSALILLNCKEQGGNASVVLGGGSMLPFLREGQSLTVDCRGGGRIAVGDIIVFERAGRLSAHRVVGTFRNNGERWYVEKGDSQLNWGVVAHGDVIGKVIGVDGQELPLSRGKVARAAGYLFAKWSYTIAATTHMLEMAPCRFMVRKFPWVERLVRGACLRGSDLLLRLLLRIFKLRTKQTQKG